MTHQDAEAIVSIAALAALADGQQDEHELAQLVDAAKRFGLLDADAAIEAAVGGQLSLVQLAEGLSSAEAKHAAYDVAAAVCNASGPANPQEDTFLLALASALNIDATSANAAVTAVLDTAPPVILATPLTSGTPVGDTLDAYILDQAMLTAALELLPDRLANIAILPLQLRMVHHIGQQYGQQTDVNQIKDLAATFGLGAAAQIMESVVRKAFGGIASGLLGGLFGGAAGLAAGGAVTFAATYALGRASQQYYAQNRSLSTADMKALFARFQGEATTIYPKVQGRIATLAQGTSLASILQSVTR